MKPLYYLTHKMHHESAACVTGWTDRADADRARATYNGLGAQVIVSAYVAVSDVAEALRACAGDPEELRRLAAELEHWK